MGIDGTKLPGGAYRISPEENAMLCRSTGAEPNPEGRAHPIFYYVAGQVGMGISVADLLKLCDFDVADGPMMTSSAAAFEGELMVGQTYMIQGEIVSLVRKPSRTFGAVDLLNFRLTLRGSGGEKVVECTNQWVLPRRNGDIA